MADGNRSPGQGPIDLAERVAARIGGATPDIPAAMGGRDSREGPKRETFAEFVLTENQQEQRDVIGSAATHILDYGGARGGKTFGFCHAIIKRAIMAPESRHLCVRWRANAAKIALRLDTIPKVFAKAFPGVRYETSEVDGYFYLPDYGSEIWYGGLDEPKRVEKYLGREFSTIFFNEGSEIPFPTVAILRTRLAQKAHVVLPGSKLDGRSLRLKTFNDLNPTTRSHWTYQEFFSHISPVDKVPIPNPEDYAVLKTNPEDNAANIAPEFLKQLASLPELQRKRFLLGEYISDIEGALWRSDMFLRVPRERVPPLKRIVVAVDPSGGSKQGGVAGGGGETGVVVAGVCHQGNAYVLEDISLRAPPGVWARMVIAAYNRHQADAVVYERNYGGTMGRDLIHTIDKSVNVKLVSARDGKHVRAEPVAGLYERGIVRHAGKFDDLEDQLMGFTVEGYMGHESPDRADALVWAITDLLVKQTGGAGVSKFNTSS